MAITEEKQAVNGRLYNLTGAANYTSGTDLGLLADGIRLEMVREISFYDRMDTGTTPTRASIDGSSLFLQFGLVEYTAEVIKLLMKKMRKTGTTLTYSGPQGTTYPLGIPLDDTYTYPLLIADQGTQGDRPALYIPKAIVTRVNNLSLNLATPVMDEATFEVVGLHDTGIGGPFIFGDVADFPSLDKEQAWQLQLQTLTSLSRRLTLRPL